MSIDTNNFFARGERVPLSYLIVLPFRNLWTNIHPLWSWREGAWNPQADSEGPMYVMGVPPRDKEPGKAVFATKALFDKFPAFLLTGRVLGADGAPLADTKLDIWHADADGSYYMRTYALRGTVNTDSNGRFEVLTVPCARYGLNRWLTRTAHFHFIVTPPKSDKTGSQGFVTQQYLCPRNDPEDLKNDTILSPKPVNMLKAWGIPDASGRTFMDLPPLEDKEMQAKVNDWNRKLSDAGSSAKVTAGGFNELKLTTEKGWF